MSSCRVVVLVVIASCPAWPQKPDPAIRFEVASVKVSSPMKPGERMVNGMGCSGGPGTTNPGQYTCFHTPVRTLISQAFDLKPYEFKPSPVGDTYDVTAKVPAGSTREQMRIMLQNLLTERFKFQYHWEQKESQVFELGIGKNGPKLKESPPPDPVAADAPSDSSPQRPRMTTGPDGMPIIQMPRGGTSLAVNNGRILLRATDMSMEKLASTLSNQLGKPVTDQTGLTGKYDITLTYAADSAPGFPMLQPPSSMSLGAADDPAPTLIEAVQRDLGLKLEQKKGFFKLFVIDRVEKTPTAN